VTGEAKAAFERARTHDPKLSKARFFLGVAAQQDGQGEQALTIWRGIIADAQPGSPWIGMVRETIASVEGRQTPSAESSGHTGGTCDGEGPVGRACPKAPLHININICRLDCTS